MYHWSFFFQKFFPNNEQPFFIYLAYTAIGAPNQVPDKYLKKCQVGDPRRARARVYMCVRAFVCVCVCVCVRACERTNAKWLNLPFDCNTPGLLRAGGQEDEMRHDGGSGQRPGQGHEVAEGHGSAGQHHRHLHLRQRRGG